MALHSKRSLGTLLYFRLVGGSDYKILHAATDYSFGSGEAAEVDVTSHSSLHNIVEKIPGIIDAGDFTASVDLQLTKSGSPVTGENALNAAHEELFEAVGDSASVYEFVLVLAKKDTVQTVLSATPATDRSWLAFNGWVKSFSVSGPVDGKYSGELVVTKTTKTTLNTVA